MRITDLWEDRTPAAASTRRRPGRVRPPRLKAPIRRKLRRDRECATTGAGALRPWHVGIGIVGRYAKAGLFGRGSRYWKLVSPRFAPRSTPLRRFLYLARRCWS